MRRCSERHRLCEVQDVRQPRLRRLHIDRPALGGAAEGRLANSRGDPLLLHLRSHPGRPHHPEGHFEDGPRPLRRRSLLGCGHGVGVLVPRAQLPRDARSGDGAPERHDHIMERRRAPDHAHDGHSDGFRLFVGQDLLSVFPGLLEFRILQGTGLERARSRPAEVVPHVLPAVCLRRGRHRWRRGVPHVGDARTAVAGRSDNHPWHLARDLLRGES
mmetsp:Transcript_109062/g.274422  ORF Transcript_109062/g.274422 Transcript_109062/m.274422 type:complete len:216 (+) Transcript_109062:414-1061(+)